jgi:hypothetical protein
MTSRLVVHPKFIYSSIEVSNLLVLTVYCRLIKFLLQTFALFIPEMPAGVMSCVVQIIPKCYLSPFISRGCCSHCCLASFLGVGWDPGYLVCYTMRPDVPAVDGRWWMNVKQSVEWVMGETEVLRGNLSQCCLVYYTSDMTQSGIEPGPLWWEAGD